MPSLLRSACEYESINFAKYVMTFDSTNVDFVGPDGTTALAIALGHLNAPLVSLLLSRKTEMTLALANAALEEIRRMKDNGKIEHKFLELQAVLEAELETRTNEKVEYVEYDTTDPW